VLKLSREDGFTISEMLVSTTIMLLITGATLTTFKNAVQINDAASQLGDSTQNLRAGTNLLIRDLMMAGRIIGAEGIAMPNGGTLTAFYRPGPPPPSPALTFPLVQTDEDDSGNAVIYTTNLPSLTTGYQGGAVVNASTTDLVTIMTVDEFMPTVNMPTDGTIAADSSFITLPAGHPWLVNDTVNDTKALVAGDLVFFKNEYGNAIQYVTNVVGNQIQFANSGLDVFHFNQRNATNVPIYTLKGTTDTSIAWFTPPSPAAPSPPTTLFRAMMITYYVDGTTASTPRLTRRINNFPAVALAGVVEDLDITYDLVDGVNNPSNVTQLPWTDTTLTPHVTYNSNQIRKVNVHVGVRSEQISKPTQDYVRNHINTSVDVRSLASVDRYQSVNEIQ
jgi:type II secretory pathway pseudopilin PulG